jgi:ribosomal protein S18 acetylase RimI-like enzyme
MAERIEALREEYLDGCTHLYVSTFNAEPWNQRWTLETTHKKLAWTLGVPGFSGWVLSLDDVIVAFAAGYRQQEYRGEVFYLAILCVGPQAQGTGVGSRLTRHLEDELQKQGVRKVYLITRRDTPAQAFYGKHAYKVSDEDIVMSHEW